MDCRDENHKIYLTYRSIQTRAADCDSLENVNLCCFDLPVDIHPD